MGTKDVAYCPVHNTEMSFQDTDGDGSWYCEKCDDAYYRDELKDPPKEVER